MHAPPPSARRVNRRQLQSTEARRGEGRELRSPRPRPLDTCITVRFNRTANRTVIECLTFFSVRIAIREHAILEPFCVWPSHLSDRIYLDGSDGLSDSPSIVVFSRVRNGHCSALAFLTVTPALRAGLSLRAAARVLWRGSAPLDGAFFAPSLGRDPRWVTMLLVRGCTSGCGHQAAGCMGQQVHFRVCKRDSCEI